MHGLGIERPGVVTTGDERVLVEGSVDRRQKPGRDLVVGVDEHQLFAPRGAAPTLRAWAAPGRSAASTRRTERLVERRAKSSTRAAVPSPEALSATTISQGSLNTCPARASSWRPSVAAASRAGITTEITVAVPGETVPEGLAAAESPSAKPRRGHAARPMPRAGRWHCRGRVRAGSRRRRRRATTRRHSLARRFGRSGVRRCRSNVRAGSSGPTVKPPVVRDTMWKRIARWAYKQRKPARFTRVQKSASSTQMK